QAADLLVRNYRIIARDASVRDVVYKTSACYTINKNGETYRGCIRVPVGQSGCDAVKEELQLPQESDDASGCNLCLTDKCNGSAGLKVSLGALIVILAMGLKNLF
ncbi:hypothetical protein KR018_001634, partial [Drosophila ironensis]